MAGSHKLSGRPVTLRDIAMRCGVHVTTVSLAVRGVANRVNPETCARILAVARELGYDPQANHAARRLRLAHTGQHVPSRVAAVLMSPLFIRETYFFTMFRAVLETMSAARYSVMSLLDEGLGASMPMPLILQHGEVDGLITTAMSAPLRDRLRAETGNLPLVSMIFPLDGVACVMADDRAGGCAAVSYLLAQGHRHILHFHREKPGAPGWERILGYEDAYRQAGLDHEAGLYQGRYAAYGKDENARDWVWDAIEPELTAHPGITAILAQNDHTAVQIYEALQQHGLRVPEDISLIGFDDTHVIHKGDGENILTSVRVPLAEIGHEAARLLLGIIHGEEPHDTQRVLPVELVARKSVRAV